MQDSFRIHTEAAVVFKEDAVSPELATKQDRLILCVQDFGTKPPIPTTPNCTVTHFPYLKKTF